MNRESMLILTKHFGSSAALEGDNSRKLLSSCLHPGPSPRHSTGCFLERRIRFIVKIKRRTVSCMVIPGAILTDLKKLAKHFPHCLRWILQWVRGWANGYARQWAQPDAIVCGRLTLMQKVILNQVDRNNCAKCNDQSGWYRCTDGSPTRQNILTNEQRLLKQFSASQHHWLWNRRPKLL